VLLRIYRTEPRSDFERLQKLALTPDKQRVVIADNMGLESLDELTVSEQQRLFSSKWIRIEAKTLDAGDLPTRRIYYTGFRLPFDDYDGTSIPLPGLGCAAFNLRGPAEAEIVLAESQEPTRLKYYSVYAIAEAGLDLPVSTAALQSGESVFCSLAEGVQSLMVCNENLHPVVIRVGITGEKALPEGFAGLLADPDAEGRYYAVGDTLSISMPMADVNEGEYLRFSTEGFGARDIMRLDVRRMEPKDADAGVCKVDIDFINKKNKTVHSHTEAIPFVHSRFERAIPFAGESEEERLSDVTSLYLRPGGDMSMISVQGECIAGVRAFTEQPYIGPEHNPYTENLQGRIWRYRLLPSAYWHPLMPMDWQQLASDNRFMRVTLQARLQPLPEKEELPPEEIFWDSGRPASTAQQVIALIEQTELPETLVPEERFWIACEAGQPVSVTLPKDPGATDAAILEGMYYIPEPTAIAGDFTVLVQGNRVVHETPAVRRGDFRVGNIGGRKQKIAWEHSMQGSGPNMLLRIEPQSLRELAALDSCKVYKSYQLTRIAPKTSQGFSISLDEDFDSGLNIHAMSRALPYLRVSLDGGKPRRINRIITPYFTRGMAVLKPRWDEVNPHIWIPDMPQLRLRSTARQYMSLDGDLLPGAHRVVIYNGSAQAVWIRTFYQVRDKRVTPGISVKTIRSMEVMP